ncbi:MAG: SDR family NAD(P)-dependent oxidoreductase [Lacunisphaera sp.]
MNTTSQSSPAKIAIVTGGSRGLGRSTVLSLARRGVHSIFTYNSARAEADKVVAAVRAAGARAVALQLDVGNVGAFDAFVTAVQSALAELGVGRFDYLVNNAGTSHHADFARTTEAELDGLYNVHFKGVFFLTQKLLPLINDGGRIVNLSSGLTRFTIPGSAPYAAMKGRRRGSDPLSREGAGIAPHRRQYGRARCDRDGFQRRPGPGQSGTQPARHGNDRARARRRARGHRADDRLAPLRGKPLDQRPAHRGLRRHEHLSRQSDSPSACLQTRR